MARAQTVRDAEGWKFWMGRGGEGGERGRICDSSVPTSPSLTSPRLSRLQSPHLYDYPCTKKPQGPWNQHFPFLQTLSEPTKLTSQSSPRPNRPQNPRNQTYLRRNLQRPPRARRRTSRLLPSIHSVKLPTDPSTSSLPHPPPFSFFFLSRLHLFPSPQAANPSPTS